MGSLMPLQIAKPGISRIRGHMVDGQSGAAPVATTLLHSNENAFGPSPHAIAAFRAAAHSLERYIEHSENLLVPQLSERYGPDTASITMGQGSDDLLARLARVYLGPGTTLVRLETGYLKVPNYAYANDAEVISVSGDGFETSVDALLAALDERTRMVYVANPENPAGTFIGARELKRLHNALPNHVLLVIDAAYEEFVDAPDAEPTHALFKDQPNVVICRTFSKVFGLASARVGWATGTPDTLDPVRRIGLTFPVTAPSLFAAKAALCDTGHETRVIGETIRLRIWLTQELIKLGLEPLPSQANFVLVRFPNPGLSAAAATEALAAKGILIRRFASPLFDGYARITIGHEHELQFALNALSTFLDEGKL